jgi:hypothetical protein
VNAPAEWRVEWLTIAGDPPVWRSLGLTVTDDGLIALYGTSLRIVSGETINGEAASGILSWTLTGADREFSAAVDPESGTDDASKFSIDGLHTEFATARGPIYADHALGATALDHVVVLTPSLERTSAAITAATGSDLRRIREVGTMRQGFHRLGRREAGLIVELVERPEVPDGPAQFWGVVLIVEDLDAACTLLGPDRVGDPKDAVQPGRRIATVRADVGLGLPVALMSP